CPRIGLDHLIDDPKLRNAPARGSRLRGRHDRAHRTLCARRPRDRGADQANADQRQAVEERLCAHGRAPLPPPPLAGEGRGGGPSLRRLSSWRGRPSRARPPRSAPRPGPRPPGRRSARRAPRRSGGGGGSGVRRPRPAPPPPPPVGGGGGGGGPFSPRTELVEREAPTRFAALA